MLLVVGWDGACFDVLQPLLAAGRLPVLAGLLARAAVREVVSTTPAATFPAWTTFVTAASPARHGITDFTVRDGYGVRFLNATHRRLPALWSVVAERGGSAGVYALPATYPPEKFNGVMVCGFDTPLGAGRLGARTHPDSLGAQIEARYGGLAVGGPSQARIDEGWHDRALTGMLRTVELRAHIVSDLIRAQDFDCFLVHFAESDTVAHQFWQYSDPRSPRFALDEPRDAVARVYAALDRALGALLDAAGPDADVMLVSDHGSGGTSDRAVFWNRWLADKGYLRFREAAALAAASRFGRAAALKLVPARWQASLLGAWPVTVARLESAARLGGVAWHCTQAFSEELSYFPAIWLNLRGRDPQGCVAPSAANAIRDCLTADLLAMRDPVDGAHVVKNVRRREDVANGAYAHRIPDLLLELREPSGYSYACMSSRGGAEKRAVRRLRREEMSGARGTSMAGSHRTHGLCVLAGARVCAGEYPVGTLADAGATAMALCGCAPHPAADGRAWSDCITGPLDVAPSVLDVEQEPVAYDGDEEAAVSDRLRALGYLS